MSGNFTLKGFSNRADEPAVKGTHNAGGTGVYGISQSGTAGQFEGNVEVKGEIIAKEFKILDAQAGTPGLAKQVADMIHEVEALKRDLDALKSRPLIAHGKTIPGATAWQVYG